MNTPESDPLSGLLKTWQVQPHLPHDFQAQVWHRIAAREQEEPVGRWRDWLYQLRTWAMRPAFAVAAVALSVFLGAGLGRAKLDQERTQAWKKMEERYQESVNPVTQHLMATVTR